MLASALGSCAWSLDGADRPPDADGGPPALAGCAAFRDDTRGVIGASGRVQSWTAAGRTYVAADRVHLAGDMSIAPVVFEGMPAGCLAALPDPLPAATIDTTALAPDLAAQLLSVFEVADQRWAYVQMMQGLQVTGVALAAWDEAARSFIVGPEYLFTADRPRFGDAVLIIGDRIYAYGCRTTGFLSDSCYVARVPVARVADRTAYEYYRSGADFGPDIEDAWPLFDGGGGLAVVARGARVYAAYVTPLGDRITMRSGLGPAGPWSAPVEVTRCEHPAGAFCAAVAAHPALSADPAALPLTYAIASFEPLSTADGATRYVVVSLGDLP